MIVTYIVSSLLPLSALKVFSERCRVEVLAAGRLAEVRGLVLAVAHSRQVVELRGARQPPVVRRQQHFFAFSRGFDAFF